MQINYISPIDKGQDSFYLEMAPAKTGARTNGFSSLKRKRRTSARHHTQGAFFVPVIKVCGGCVRDTERCAGFLLPRSANPYTAASHHLAVTVGGSDYAKGAYLMAIHTRNLSARLAQHQHTLTLTKTILKHCDDSESEAVHNLVLSFASLVLFRHPRPELAQAIQAIEALQCPPANQAEPAMMAGGAA